MPSETPQEPSSAAAANATALSLVDVERVPAEPFSIGRLFARALPIFGRCFVPLTALTLGVHLPWIAANAASLNAPQSGPWHVVSTVLSLLAQPLAVAAAVAAVADAVAGRPMNVVASLLRVLRRAHIVVVAAFVQAILCTLGLVMCLVPGFIAMSMWWLAISAVVVENKGPIESLQRSAELTAGHRGAIGVLAFLQMLLGSFATVFLTTATWLPFAARTGLSSLATVILAALGAVVGTLAYVDLRAEKEPGFDLDDALGR